MHAHIHAILFLWPLGSEPPRRHPPKKPYHFQIFGSGKLPGPFDLHTHTQSSLQGPPPSKATTPVYDSSPPPPLIFFSELSESGYTAGAALWQVVWVGN